MSTDLLRKAAARIRSTSDLPTSAPWRAVAAGGEVEVRGPRGAFVAFTGGERRPASMSNAIHIAAWSPDVTVLVAALLDETADDLDQRGVTARLRATEVAAVTLARHIMKEDPMSTPLDRATDEIVEAVAALADIVSQRLGQRVARDALTAALTGPDVAQTLAQHQFAPGACSCGEQWPEDTWTVVEQDKWLSEHQAAAVRAALLGGAE